MTDFSWRLEPPPGSRVRDAHGREWEHQPEGYWMMAPDYDEPESWIRVNEYGPLVAVSIPLAGAWRSRAEPGQQNLTTRPPDDQPRVDVIYRQGSVLGIVYGIPAVAPVAPLLPEGAEAVATLYIPEKSA